MILECNSFENRSRGLLRIYIVIIDHQPQGMLGWWRQAIHYKVEKGGAGGGGGGMDGGV